MLRACSIQRCFAILIGAASFQHLATMAAPLVTDLDEEADMDQRETNGTGAYRYSHEYRYRTRTLTAPHEGSSSTGVEVTCIVHFEVDSGIDHDSIVTMTISQPHVFRLGSSIPNEQ
eukprot:gene12651-16635_t